MAKTYREFGPIEDSREWAPSVAGPVVESAEPVTPVGSPNIVGGEGSLGSVIGTTLDIPGKGVVGFHVDDDGTVRMGDVDGENLLINGATGQLSVSDATAHVAVDIVAGSDGVGRIIFSGSGVDIPGEIAMDTSDSSPSLTMFAPYDTGDTSPVLSLIPAVDLADAVMSLTMGSFEMEEKGSTNAPASNRVRIYAEDNGSGKTRLMARFSTGAAQQIAIQP